jgi:hypothetical protein
MAYRKNSTPEDRLKDKDAEQYRVRRKYKKDLTLKRKFLPGEVEYIEEMVVVLHLAGYSKVQMASIIGVSTPQITKILQDPAVSEKLVKIRAALPQAALDLLQGYMVEAVQAIVDIMRISEDDAIVLKAAGEILDRAGLSKASRQERHQINENRTVLTDDGLLEKLRAASPEVQEQAAQAIEQLEKLLTDTVKRADVGE